MKGSFPGRFFVRFVWIYFGMVLVGGSIPAGAGKYRKALAASDETSFVYLLSNGWHEELCLPAAACTFEKSPAGYLNIPEPDKGFYILGWGDRDFFIHTPYLRMLTPKTTFKALFLPSSAVLKIDYIPFVPGGKHVTPIPVTNDMITALYAFADSRIKKENGIPKIIPPEEVDAAYGDAIFFEAKEKYSLLYTCNNWTSRAFKRSGIASHLWTPLAWKVSCIR